MSTYKMILTNYGRDVIATAAVTQAPVKLLKMGAGDSDGEYYEPTPEQTNLRNEIWRGDINDLYSLDNVYGDVLSEAVIPPEAAPGGGWYVREIGVYDDKGGLFAVGSYPLTFQPDLLSGSAKQIYLKVVIEVDNVAAIQLIVDHGLVLATRADIDALYDYMDSANLEIWRQVLLDAGLTVVGTFESGVVVTTPRDAVWSQYNGLCYTYKKSLPFAVVAGSRPDDDWQSIEAVQPRFGNFRILNDYYSSVTMASDIDISQYIQSAINSGTLLSIPDGQYLVKTKVTIDNSGVFPVMGRASRRLNFCGSSMSNTTFNTTGNDCIEYIANDNIAIGQGQFSGMTFSDFTIYGQSNAGIGFKAIGAQYLRARDLHFIRCNIGLFLHGVLSSDIRDIISHYCNVGLYIEGAVNSSANAMKINGVFSANDKFGITGTVGAKITFDSCNFENNGIKNQTECGGVYLRVSEPMSTINFRDCYFSYNRGYADLTIVNDTAADIIVNVSGCEFLRGATDGGYTLYNIATQSPGGGRILLNLQGDQFFTQRAFGYVSSKDRPMIKLDTWLTITGWDTCISNDYESLSDAMSSNSSVTSISVDANGTVVSAPQYIGVNKTGAGIYYINSAIQLAVGTTSYHVVAISRSTGLTVSYINKLTTKQMRLVTIDSGGVPTDAAFDLLITKSK